MYITYENVILQKDGKNNTYIAEILTSDISYDWKEQWLETLIRWDLSASYSFLPNHSFSDIAIAFINTNIKNTKIYLLSGNNIYIEEDISIEKIEAFSSTIVYTTLNTPIYTYYYNRKYKYTLEWNTLYIFFYYIEELNCTQP